MLDDIIKKSIDKFEGLIKISVIEKKLETLGDNLEDRI